MNTMFTRTPAITLFLTIVAPAVGQVPPPKNPKEVLSEAYKGKSYSPAP